MNVRLSVDEKTIIDTDYATLLANAMMGQDPPKLDEMPEDGPQDNVTLAIEGICSLHMDRNNTIIVVDADLEKIQELSSHIEIASELLPDEIKGFLGAFRHMLPTKVIGQLDIDYPGGTLHYDNNLVTGQIDVPFGINAMDKAFG